MKLDKLLEAMARQEKFEQLDEAINWSELASKAVSGIGKALGGLLAGITTFLKAFGDAFKKKTEEGAEKYAKEAEARKAKGESNAIGERNEALRTFVENANVSKDVLNKLKTEAGSQNSALKAKVVNAMVGQDTALTSTPPTTPVVDKGQPSIAQFNKDVGSNFDEATTKRELAKYGPGDRQLIIKYHKGRLATPMYKTADYTLALGQAKPDTSIGNVGYTVVCADDERDFMAKVLVSIYESFNANAVYAATGARFDEDVLRQMASKPLADLKGYVPVKVVEVPKAVEKGQGSELIQRHILTLKNLPSKGVMKIDVGGKFYDIGIGTADNLDNVAYLNFSEVYKAIGPAMESAGNDFNETVKDKVEDINNKVKSLSLPAGIPKFSLNMAKGKPSHTDRNYSVKVEWV